MPKSDAYFSDVEGGPKDVPTPDKPTVGEEQAKDDGVDNGGAKPKAQQSL